uniref:RING-type domain-containing protein n=1 Tax=Salvator merianae TaxID=96440 RepID=A0A8D0EEL0_SALMN
TSSLGIVNSIPCLYNPDYFLQSSFSIYFGCIQTGLFREPVTTACGHNFCMDCLQDYWDHQALIGECPYCPQCREPFNSRPQLRKNITLGEIAMRFTREDAQRSRRLAGPTDVPCDFCSPRKLKAINIIKPEIRPLLMLAS